MMKRSGAKVRKAAGRVVVQCFREIGAFMTVVAAAHERCVISLGGRDKGSASRGRVDVSFIVNCARKANR